MPFKNQRVRTEYQREWHRQARIKRRKKALERLGAKCVICGNDDWRVLQIDHIKIIRRQTFTGAIGSNYIRLIANGQEPTDNLQILCANCHMIKTLDDRFTFNNYKR